MHIFFELLSIVFYIITVKQNKRGMTNDDKEKLY